MSVDADDILLVSGSLQALDLVNQTLLRAGDTVVIEASNYEGVYARFNRLDVILLVCLLTPMACAWILLSRRCLS